MRTKLQTRPDEEQTSIIYRRNESECIPLDNNISAGEKPKGALRLFPGSIIWPWTWKAIGRRETGEQYTDREDASGPMRQ